MTCIVGYVDTEKVYIGGDSAACSGWNIKRSTRPKVFKNGQFLIGYTSSFRMGQILETMSFSREQFPVEEDYQYMVTSFVPQIRKQLVNLGYVKKENNEETSGEFLVGYNKKLYKIACDFAVHEWDDYFNSIGCGQDFAIGALDSMKNLVGVSPEWKITKALETAERFSAGVRGPFTILSI